MIDQKQTKTTVKPCGRDECGKWLICCRSDCPLVVFEAEPGLTRVMLKSDWKRQLMPGNCSFYRE